MYAVMTVWNTFSLDGCLMWLSAKQDWQSEAETGFGSHHGSTMEMRQILCSKRISKYRIV